VRGALAMTTKHSIAQELGTKLKLDDCRQYGGIAALQ
jgi:hypothetical protein